MTSGIVAAIASRSPREMESPATLNSSFCEPIRSGTPRCEAPSQRMPTFCRMNEKPTAVISGRQLGRARVTAGSPRVSIITFSEALTNMATTSISEQPAHQADGAGGRA